MGTSDRPTLPDGVLPPSSHENQSGETTPRLQVAFPSQARGRRT